MLKLLALVSIFSGCSQAAVYSRPDGDINIGIALPIHRQKGDAQNEFDIEQVSKIQFSNFF